MSRSLKLKRILSNLLVILALISVNQWSILPLGNTYTNWLIYLIISIVILLTRKYYFNMENDSLLIFIKIYVFWVLICFIRGLFVAENYWDYKNLMNSSFALFLIVSVYIFTSPLITFDFLRAWLKYALPLFLLFSFLITTDSYGYYLVPISFFALFFPELNLRWRLLIVAISLMVVLIDLDARSNVIKFAFPLVLSLFLYIKKTIKSDLLKVIHICLIALPLVFFVLAISGIFNVLRIEDYISGDYVKTKIVAGEVREVNLKIDTRTFIYDEVITSAIKNKYFLFGRTPARGYDSNYFGVQNAEELGTGRYERYGNEVSILNIFTWTGILGLFFYFLIFYKASYFAIYHSKSNYLKLLGLYIAFRWAYAWVEDFNRFDIMNVMLWVCVAICYSKEFRSMTDKEFKIWFNAIFSKRNKIHKSDYATVLSSINNSTQSKI